VIHTQHPECVGSQIWGQPGLHGETLSWKKKSSNSQRILQEKRIDIGHSLFDVKNYCRVIVIKTEYTDIKMNIKDINDQLIFEKVANLFQLIQWVNMNLFYNWAEIIGKYVRKNYLDTHAVPKNC
jgi:hypothetical protein